MKLSFDREDDVEILLRFHEVAEIGCDHLRDLGVVVRVGPEGGFLPAFDVEGLVFIFGILNEVGVIALAQQAQVVLAHHETSFSRLHC